MNVQSDNVNSQPVAVVQSYYHYLDFTNFAVAEYKASTGELHKSHNLSVINSMEQSPSWEANQF
jgi:hypothetical protein